MLISMFLSVIMVLSCISMIESTTCNRSQERTMISEMRSLLESLENKINDNSCKCSANENKCPGGWKKYKDHCYFFSPDSKTWHNAANQLSTNMALGLGLADLKKEDEWRWVHDSSKVRYSQWYPGQPSNIGNNQSEDCGSFWSDAKYQWNDVSCKSNGMGYVCECSHGPDCRPFNG
ncbi:perlucin-like protein [Mytilus californianus]|uniref:perlucin-like protein n=1 Tax=Mytilus californianus TaxID=6549 RepID=UPI002247FDD0|nr:perlucin-like protein [Mytilus californianus]